MQPWRSPTHFVCFHICRSEPKNTLCFRILFIYLCFALHLVSLQPWRCIRFIQLFINLSLIMKVLDHVELITLSSVIGP
ncbi:hypothetical protein Hanom_Chr12g01125941 [Helianthus anomalus]